MALPKGIQVFGPSKLSNAAYGEFMKVVARLISRGTCEKLGVDAAAFTGFQSHLARLVEITKELRQQKETLELNDLDRERDGLLVYLLWKIALEKSSPKQATREAAEALTLRRKQYLGIQDKPNREETFLIDGLIADAEKAEIKAALQALGLKETVDKLKAVNASYSEKMFARSEANLAQNPLPAKAVRKDIDAFYNEVVRKVDAMNVLTPSVETNAFVLSLNKLIKDTNDAWKLHKVQLGMWTEEGGREDEEEGTWTTGEKSDAEA